MVRPKDKPINPPGPFKKIRRLRLYEEIAEQIKKAIRNGEFKPGDRLPSERELSEAFNVGRPAIREALRSLSAMDLIQVNMGKKGSVVKETDVTRYVSAIKEQLSWLLKTDKTGLQELWEVRRYIELGIAHGAATHATRKEIAGLELMMKKMEASHNDMTGYFKLAVKFHEKLALASKNRIFYIVWGMLGDVLLKGYLPILDQLFPEGPSRLLKANRLLFKAVKSKDFEAINKAMEIHAAEENIFPSVL